VCVCVCVCDSQTLSQRRRQAAHSRPNRCQQCEMRLRDHTRTAHYIVTAAVSFDRRRGEIVLSYTHAHVIQRPVVSASGTSSVGRRSASGDDVRGRYTPATHRVSASRSHARAYVCWSWSARACSPRAVSPCQSRHSARAHCAPRTQLGTHSHRVYLPCTVEWWRTRHRRCTVWQCTARERL
jgi:hypothetical protein